MQGVHKVHAVPTVYTQYISEQGTHKVHACYATHTQHIGTHTGCMAVRGYRAFSCKVAVVCRVMGVGLGFPMYCRARGTTTSHVAMPMVGGSPGLPVSPSLAGQHPYT